MSSGAVITGNVIYDNGGVGIQLLAAGAGHSVLGTTVTFNTIDGNASRTKSNGEPYAGLAIGYAGEGVAASNNRVENNLITNSVFGWNVTSWGTDQSRLTGNVVHANCLFAYPGNPNSGNGGLNPQGAYQATDNSAVDPLYVNRTEKDFRLQSGSPCTGKGAPTPSDWRADAERPWDQEWASWSCQEATTDPPMTDRFERLPAPGGRSGLAYRFEVRDGDNAQTSQDTVSKPANERYGERCELGQDNPGRPGFPLFSEGEERWISWSVYLPDDYPIEATTWNVLNQWKQLGGLGVPALSMEVQENQFKLMNSAANYQLTCTPGPCDYTKPIWSGPAQRNRWTTFILHVKFSPDPAVGFVELYGDLDGAGTCRLLPSLRTHTMKRDAAGTTVQSHARIGIYRNPAIQGTAHAYFDDYVVAAEAPPSAGCDEPGGDDPTPGTFFGLATPTRILNTVDGTGVAAPGRVTQGQTTVVDVTGPGSVPNEAVAVVLNVTVTGAEVPLSPTNGLSYLSVTPGGGNTTSNLNFRGLNAGGQDMAALVKVPVASDGNVRIYNDRGATHVIADVFGYYLPGDAGSKFTPVAPTRVLDPTQVGPGQTLTADVTDVAGATAVALNVTVSGATADSFLSVTPAGGNTTSNLNFRPVSAGGQDIANLVIVPVDANGQVRIYNDQGSVFVIADLLGVYHPTTGVAYTPLIPARVLQPTPVGAGQTLEVDATTGAVPANASAVVLNVTVTGANVPLSPTAGLSYLSVTANGGSTTSSLNFKGANAGGQDIANLVVAPVGAGGNVRIYNDKGSAYVIADVFGFFP